MNKIISNSDKIQAVAAGVVIGGTVTAINSVIVKVPEIANAMGHLSLKELGLGAVILAVGTAASLLRKDE